ncbi:TIR domain-containing protein [bacterium]|nr:TIR domain-containing protein [bacterium]
MTDIFISYKKEDVHRVEPIARALADAGYEVWWDHRIPPGRSYREVIGETLATAKCVMVLWSEKSSQAQWVLDEADEGKQRNVLLPVLIDDVPIPYGFRQLEAARLIGWTGDTHDAEWVNVLGAVQHFVGRAPGGPPKPLPALSAMIGTGPAAASTSAPRSTYQRRPEPAKSSPVIPLVGAVAAIALLGGGGYFAWQSGMFGGGGDDAGLDPGADGAPVEVADAGDAADAGAVEATGEATGEAVEIADADAAPDLPAAPAQQPVIVPGDEYGTFFASGYAYCDAKLIGAYWNMDIGETKALVGRKIMSGLAANIPGILRFARQSGTQCDFVDAGYAYEDAERLAQLWGLASVWDAKVKIGALATAGQRARLVAALGR